MFQHLKRCFLALKNAFQAQKSTVKRDEMKRLLVIFGLLAILATAQSASAQELLLNSSISHIDISENSASEKITLNYVVSEVGENALEDSLLVYGTLPSVSVYDTEGTLESSVEPAGGGFSRIKFDLRKTLMAGDLSTVTVEFTKTTTSLDGNYSYDIRYRWNTQPNVHQIIATFPEGYTFLSASENTSSIYTSDSNLNARWSGVQENQFQVEITFGVKSQPSENQEGGQLRGAPSPPYVLMLAAVAGALAAVGAFLKFRPRRPGVKVARKVRRPPVVSKEDVRRMLGMLTEHERKVVKELVRRDNLTQRVLCDRTGIPKATMSRVLQRLENKGIVSRIGYGASKRVLLTKWAQRWRCK